MKTSLLDNIYYLCSEKLVADALMQIEADIEELIVLEHYDEIDQILASLVPSKVNHKCMLKLLKLTQVCRHELCNRKLFVSLTKARMSKVFSEKKIKEMVDRFL